jgi:hypothetical protein
MEIFTTTKLGANPNSVPPGTRKVPTIIETTLQPGEVRTVYVVGTAFYLIQSGGVLNVKPDIFDNSSNNYYAKQGQYLSADLVFSYLTITNKNATALTFKLWVGWGAYQDNIQDLRDQPTVTVGTGVTSLLASNANPVTLNGVGTGNRIQRRLVLIANEDPATNFLEVYDQSGNKILTVFPFTNVAIPTSGYVQIRNNTLTAINVSIAEVWYIQQA